MSDSWRAVDSGLRSAAQNVALDRALLEARQAEEIPSTLRFLRYAPSALLGSGQSAAQELDLVYCNAHGIAIQRRITGGDTIFTDEHQLDWALYLHRRDIGSASLQEVAKRIYHAAATAVGALGVAACFRPRSDIEIDGASVSCGGCAFDGNALLCHGTLLLDHDAGKIPHVLRIPAGQQPDESGPAALLRTTSLKNLLGHRVDPALIKRYLTEAFESEFDSEFQEGDLTLSEHVRYRIALAEIDTPDWVHLIQGPASDMPIYEAAHAYCGGVLRVSLFYNRPRHRIRRIRFGGDVEAHPRRTILDLEAALHDTSVEGLERNVRAFFAGRAVDMPALQPADFIAAVRLATKQPLVAPNRA